MNHVKLLLASTALVFLNAAYGQVVINEVSASNFSYQADNFGEFEDWVELYNAGPALVDLSGWYMSDNPNNPTKFQIQPGTTIAANDHLVVFCSGRNTNAGGVVHSNFKLNQSAGEWVLLSDAGGVGVDSYQFTDRTKTNHSRGRTTDGAATWSLFQTPTINAPNAGGGPDYVGRPLIQTPAGFYGGAQNVTITGPAGAEIRYTLDSTTPTAASTLYTGPINIASTTVLRAACFSTTPGVPSSFIETNTYFIGVTHTLPVLSASGDDVETLLNGNGGIQPVGNLEFFGVDQQLKAEAVGEFNEHGQDSWAYGQRGVDYIVRDQFGYNDALHHPIFRTKTRPSFQRIIIKAAAGDNYDFGPGQPAHIRDMYVQALSQVGELRLDERSYEPAIFYVNGQYWGVYDVREKVDDHDFTSYYYGQDEFNIQYLKTWGGTWEEYGGAQAATDWDALRNFIATNNMGDPVAFAYVDSLFNWKSLVDYFCLNSYTVCADWLNWNTGWWRGRDPNGDKKKWRYTLWDMDATFGHYTNFTGIPDQTPNADPCAAEDLPNPGGQGHTEILTKLITENQMVHDWYVNRYADLGNTLFSCDFMLPFLDSLIANIAPEMPAQIARWGGSMAAWQDNVQVLRDFIETRCVTIQQGMVDCYNLTGPYDVVFDVYPPLSGKININSITPGTYPFTGTYYGGINTTLEGVAEPGYAFSHWEINNNVVLPSDMDSLVTVDFVSTDTIVAHFVPPVAYEVMLDVDPRNSALIEFDGVLYSTFPTTVEVAEGVPVLMRVAPAQYYDFLYWSIKNNFPSPADTTLRELEVTFWSSDTIVAHLEEQDYVYYIPNSFTPNGDGVNDIWQPWGNVIDLDRFELTIFDRWGEAIYSTDDPNKGWDGTDASGTIRDGVYVYKANVVEGITKERHELFGHVTVFR
ncbi:MAG: CotH kinase family protein [Flavobacteriales bacterium]|nr:CotH kinase family protein [Flavobacteriales bacterium]